MREFEYENQNGTKKYVVILLALFSLVIILITTGIISWKFLSKNQDIQSETSDASNQYVEEKMTDSEDELSALEEDYVISEEEWRALENEVRQLRKEVEQLKAKYDGRSKMAEGRSKREDIRGERRKFLTSFFIWSTRTSARVRNRES